MYASMAAPPGASRPCCRKLTPSRRGLVVPSTNSHVVSRPFLPQYPGVGDATPVSSPSPAAPAAQEEDEMQTIIRQWLGRALGMSVAVAALGCAGASPSGPNPRPGAPATPAAASRALGL